MLRHDRGGGSGGSSDRWVLVLIVFLPEILAALGLGAAEAGECVLLAGEATGAVETTTTAAKAAEAAVEGNFASEDLFIEHFGKHAHEFGILREDGIIRTYFKPIEGLEYWIGQIARG